MLRKIIVGTAVAGVLTFGAAGIAGAATSTTPSASSGSNLSKVCAKLPKAEARIQKVEAALAARLPKAEAREAKLKSEGKTAAADRLANRITRIQNRESKVNARLAKIEAKCGTASIPSTGSTS
jgi:delta 1-pyrroline-5-carboxylate dehydrogenase